MDPNDDRHLFELLTELEQGSTGAALHLNDMLPDYYDDDYYYDDQMDDAFYNELVGAEPEEEQFICYVPGCHRVLRPFKLRKLLRQHIQYKHTPEEYYEYYEEPRQREAELRRQGRERCPYPHCNQVFINRDNLNRHIRDVHGERNFPCTYTYEGCQRVFTSDRLRKDHIKLVHENIPQVCIVPGCRRANRPFPSQKVLQQHMKNVHTKQEYRHYYENVFKRQ